MRLAVCGMFSFNINNPKVLQKMNMYQKHFSRQIKSIYNKYFELYSYII